MPKETRKKTASAGKKKAKSKKAPVKASVKGGKKQGQKPVTVSKAVKKKSPESEINSRRKKNRFIPATMRLRLRWPWKWLLSWLFGPVRVDSESIDSIRKLNEKGTVVFVSRTAGLLPFLYFNWLFLNAGLPLCRYVNGVWRRILWIFGRPVQPAPPLVGEDPDEAMLGGCVAAGRSGLVFLWRRGKPLTGRRDVFPGQHATALIRIQRRSEKPIFLVPCLLLFGQRPGRKEARPGLLDIVFGPREAPGRIRSFLAFLRFRDNAWVKFGEAIDLQSFISARTEDNDKVLGRKIRGSLAQYLAREQRVVTGPPLKHPDRLRMEVLRDRHLRDTLIEVSREKKRKLRDVENEARRYIKEIASRYSPTMIAFLSAFFGFIFNRIYDGIEIDRSGMNAVAAAAKKGPVVLCPSHRSHIDYLVLSWAFVNEGLMPPHIAAGKNLSFWPAGPILRRAGAFFIRRSFKDNRIYTAVFRAYIRRLLHERYPQEFFIEGTRSRTGKLLPPRLGMVAYEIDAFLESTRDDVFFVPISIGYTRVIEQGSYKEELLGKEKQEEDVSGLIRAGRVLRRRWGRIYIDFDKPISLAAFMEERGISQENINNKQKSEIITSLAWHIAHGIDRVTNVTPAALAAAALLTDRRRGLEMKEVIARASFVFKFIKKESNARISHALLYKGERRLDPEAVEEAVKAFADDNLVKIHEIGGRKVIEILPDGRLGLDYYKNNLLRYVVERSILAHALLTEAALRGGVNSSLQIPVSTLKTRAQTLAGLLSREFIYRPGVSADIIFNETLKEFSDSELIEHVDESVCIRSDGAGPLSMLRMLTASIVEGYWLSAGASADLISQGPVPEKELVKRILEEGRVLVLTGRLAASEALSKPVVQGALAVMVKRGHLARTGRKDTEITGDHKKMREILDLMDPYVLVPGVIPAPKLPD